MRGRKLSDGVSNNQELVSFLRILEKKLDAPILNGGFDRLFDNVQQIKTEVDKLNTAVFHTETGLFVRVKSEKVSTDQDIKDLNKKIESLDEQLKTYKKFFWGTTISIVTGGGVALVKFLWNVISSHVIWH